MRDKILTDLFKSKEFNDCIGKMRPEHLQDDLKGEVMLILCETPEDFIIDLHSRNELKYYTVRIILNQIKSETSPFYKKYRGFSVDLTAVKDVADIQNRLSDEVSGLTKKGERTLNYILESAGQDEFQSRLHEEKKNELRLMEVFNLYWYDKEMILLYLEHGNYRAIQKETNIHHVCAFKSIKKAIQQIDEAVELRMQKFQPYSPAEIIQYIYNSDRPLALEYLNNVLEYFNTAYPAELIAEFNLRIQEKEDKLQDKAA